LLIDSDPAPHPQINFQAFQRQLNGVAEFIVLFNVRVEEILDGLLLADAAEGNNGGDDA
jgi:hypothetical protein